MKIKIVSLFYCFIVKITLVLFIITILVAFPVLAIEATSSSTPSALNQVDEKIKQKIKERLEKVVDENFDQVKGLITQKTVNKTFAYVGKIKSIQNQTLDLDTYLGNKQVKVASEAAILKIFTGAPKNTLDFKDLAINDFIIAMGFKEENEVLLGKRLIITNEPPSTKRKFVYGKVVEIDNKKITWQNNGDKIALTVNEDTKLQIAGKKDPKIDDIQIGDQLRAVIITIGKNSEVNSARVLFIVPGEANPAALENEIEATPSATPKP